MVESVGGGNEITFPPETITVNRDQSVLKEVQKSQEYKDIKGELAKHKGSTIDVDGKPYKNLDDAIKAMSKTGMTPDEIKGHLKALTEELQKPTVINFEPDVIIGKRPQVINMPEEVITAKPPQVINMPEEVITAKPPQVINMPEEVITAKPPKEITFEPDVIYGKAPKK